MPGPNTQLGEDGQLEIVVRGRRNEANDAGTAAEVGAAVPPTDVDTTGSSSEPVSPPLTAAQALSLPLLELPHATGPGSDDPFDVMPPALAVGYASPLTLLDQLLTGEPSGGRTTFILPIEPGFFRDLYIGTAENVHTVILRPRISDYPVPDLRRQAQGRLAVSGALTLGAVLTPGPQDDIALSAGAAGLAARGAGKSVRALTPADLGLAERTIVDGTFAVNGAKATAYVRYLGKPAEGLGAGLLGARKALGAVAKDEGATILRIETSRVIEPTGRLAPILERAGFHARPNGTMFWEGVLK